MRGLVSEASANRGANGTWICTWRVPHPLKMLLLRGGGLEWEVLRGFEATL